MINNTLENTLSDMNKKFMAAHEELIKEALTKHGFPYEEAFMRDRMSRITKDYEPGYELYAVDYGKPTEQILIEFFPVEFGYDMDPTKIGDAYKATIAYKFY